MIWTEVQKVRYYYKAGLQTKRLDYCLVKTCSRCYIIENKNHLKLNKSIEFIAVKT